ncbi:unnamed protein product [Vicia faba]|uniref:NADH-ubiquinone oxidoreductase chain 4 n=1 Tax=Vicia faba TaxID=3906 RepID=A0AAV1BAF2_VICFA|nr:unnamed protein product [Vicia faba]
MLSHGLVPLALFLCVGVLYDRHKTRLVRYYGGLVSTMPNLSTISFSSTLANMSSPSTSSFIGEFPISVGAFQRNSLVATLAALGMILGAAYSLWLYNRVVSRNLKADFLHKFSDPNGREVSIFIPFLVGGATVRACDGADATSLSWFGWEPKLDFTKKIRLAQGRSCFLAELYLAGWDREQERTGGNHACSRLCLRGTVERATHECCRVGRANNSNAFGLIFEQESQRYLTFTMIRTPKARPIGVQYNQTISNSSNVSMRLFGNTGEPDGRGDGIWDGGLVVSL